MAGFRRGDYQVLVATNIAARGLDVEHITHVISVDVPAVPDDYVHRIGRTARAEAEGDAFVLVSPGEEKALAQIERHIGQRLPRVTLPDFDYSQSAPDRAAKAGRKPGGPGAARPPGVAPHPSRTKAGSRPPGQGKSGRNSRPPAGRQACDDPLEVGQEAHVEHAVSLVQH